jgi:hypothetical protein
MLWPRDGIWFMGRFYEAMVALSVFIYDFLADALTDHVEAAHGK